MSKNHTPLCLVLSFCTKSTLWYNNKWNAWAADNLAPLDMPFISTIP